MGADIHSMAEVYCPRYTHQGEEPTYRWTPLEAAIFPSGWRNNMTAVPFDGRNYDLFALLANVRNGFGFAGIKRGDPIQPLSEPRGVPKDASFAWLAEVDSWDVDMHSHSYFTLTELIEFEASGLLDQRMRKTGGWEDTLTESAKPVRAVITAMTRYAADHGGISHDHLRVVFGFDN